MVFTVPFSSKVWWAISVNLHIPMNLNIGIYLAMPYQPDNPISMICIVLSRRTSDPFSRWVQSGTRSLMQVFKTFVCDTLLKCLHFTICYLKLVWKKSKLKYMMQVGDIFCSWIPSNVCLKYLSNCILECAYITFFISK